MTSSRSLRSISSAAIAATLVLAACSGSDDTAATPDDTPSASMSGDMGDTNGDDHGSFAFGEPADEADADRTVEVEAFDALSYDPATVAVEAGEIVTFVVTNSGAATHEFVIGDTAVQNEHEEEMQNMEAGMQMGDEPNALELAAGETKSITWHFTQAGQLEFACHQPGHYAGGMIGTFDVS